MRVARRSLIRGVATRGNNTVSVCNVFHWIGQPFTSCDECGRPAWEHDYTHGQQEQVFGPLVKTPWSEILISAWSDNGRITQERAIELRAVKS